MKCFRLATLIVGLVWPAAVAEADDKQVQQWDVHEIVLKGPAEGNPYVDVRLEAEFRLGERTVTVPGFHDGEGNYMVRFSPDEQGRWTFTTKSNRQALAGKKGSFQCVAPSGDNHGPLRIVNTFYLQYADGTPYYAIGTTAYQWTSVDQTVQQQTLDTLAKSPFNKIRMCVFPKVYIYGNDTEPWAHPFQRDGEKADFSRPNYEFFRNFDKRVRQLRDLGIQADVIIFHPYDRWGYCKMGRDNDDRYLRYMIARLSAYRNVWWSMANEFDLMTKRKMKTVADFDRFFQICRDEDPHQRLRGNHNWYDTEDHFYDHTKPWVTHASLQTASFDKAILWRERYRKPVMFDEMRYEGDVPAAWGNLSGEEMAAYFWMAGLSGVYPTHGETLENQPKVRWWAKGGRPIGTSPKRIAFFKEFMEQAPVAEMVPSITNTAEPESPADNIHVFSKPGEYYLAYAAKLGKTIRLDLPPGNSYRVELIDTWNMKTKEMPDAKGGQFTYTTKGKYEALRVTLRK